jgi:hypothetical protein
LAAEVRAFGFGEGIGRGERNKSNEEKRARRMTHEMLEQRRGTMRCSRKEEYIIEDSAADACYKKWGEKTTGCHTLQHKPITRPPTTHVVNSPTPTAKHSGALLRRSGCSATPLLLLLLMTPSILP